MTSINQHQSEILKNKTAWESKRLLRSIYSMFYNQIAKLVDPTIEGRIVELGSGIGNIKMVIPHAVCTDIFPNPWLDAVCNAYSMPFEKNTVSHLVLFDVFHHLERPSVFFKEAHRVLNKNGRIIIFEPYISVTSRFVYGLFHHEPIAWKSEIDFSDLPFINERYYAAQGNATRLFFRRETINYPESWKIFYSQPIVSFSYLLSGGYGKPALYPESMFPIIQKVDNCLSALPSLFASRCLIGLTPR